jgi:transposase
MKNDAADAEVIVVAAQRPEMRFVEPKLQISRARQFCFERANVWSIIAPRS